MHPSRADTFTPFNWSKPCNGAPMRPKTPVGTSQSRHLHPQNKNSAPKEQPTAFLFQTPEDLSMTCLPQPVNLTSAHFKHGPG
jgi:hypothetical protein